MSEETKPDTSTLAKVNEALTIAKARNGFRTDKAFAEHLGISEKTFSFIRQGRWTNNQRALITIFTSEPRNHNAA